jgi:NAD(P)-dependent dehydrogenase (short-subunit alcohol dehydrogenase family)
MCTQYVVKVTNEDQVNQVVNYVATKFGRLDYVVNAAGIAMKHRRRRVCRTWALEAHPGRQPHGHILRFEDSGQHYVEASSHPLQH